MTLDEIYGWGLRLIQLFNSLYVALNTSILDLLADAGIEFTPPTWAAGLLDVTPIGFLFTSGVAILVVLLIIDLFRG